MELNFPQEISDAKESLGKSRNAAALSENASLELDDTKAALTAVSYESALAASHLLAVHALTTILKGKDVDIFLPSAFALQTVLLNHLTLSQRSLPLITFDGEFEDQVKTFLTSLSEIINRTISSAQDKSQFKNTADIIDGRLFRLILQAMCDGTLSEQLPEAAIQDWTLIYKAVVKLTEVKLSPKGSAKPISSTIVKAKSDLNEVSEETGVLPFSSSVFDKHLASIKVEIDTSLNTRLSAMKISREPQYWHSHKRPLNPKYAPPPKVSKWR